MNTTLKWALKSLAAFSILFALTLHITPAVQADQSMYGSMMQAAVVEEDIVEDYWIEIYSDDINEGDFESYNSYGSYQEYMDPANAVDGNDPFLAGQVLPRNVIVDITVENNKKFKVFITLSARVTLKSGRVDQKVVRIIETNRDGTGTAIYRDNLNIAHDLIIEAVVEYEEMGATKRKTDSTTVKIPARTQNIKKNVLLKLR